MSDIRSFTWEDPDTLYIDTRWGKRKCKTSNFLSGSHKFYHAQISGDEVHVFTGPSTSSRPSKKHIVKASGLYKGAKKA